MTDGSSEADSPDPGGLSKPRNPYPTVDVIVELGRGLIVLVRRKNEPLGWALPGGFIDYGESSEDAARREVLEETGLRVELKEFLAVYSHPDRDPRHHTMTVVYIARPVGGAGPRAGSDAAEVEAFSVDELPDDMAFDHGTILQDYKAFRAIGLRPGPAA
ncbi:MAG TPA: NUDIX hydrolase [Deltaproteobacteria bacterium]|nr:NUDIX hydrolase [Deltaproteobacteria bacterium]HCP44433.1 NUDIX hydrolase [Deltaproteobacteria bacterium]